ncbi:MAG: lamin tail domain-containing protein [Candidatus Cloacimonetes bacterium]|nr:lamin tail domain-containing protein [Candidatus Cloacimonadota bacterium]
MNKLKFLILFYLALSLYLKAEIVLNEVMYDPAGADNYYEWIEIFNNGDEPINLLDWTIESAGTSFIETFRFPETVINPGAFVLIGESDVPDADLYGNLNLQNGGGATDGIRLVSPERYTDTILYDEPNTNLLPDDINDPGEYFVPNVASGHTLARKFDGVDTNNINDWFDCVLPTPGSPNIFPQDVVLSELSIINSGSNLTLTIEVTNESELTIDDNQVNLIISQDETIIYESGLSSLEAYEAQIIQIPVDVTGYSIFHGTIAFENDINLSNNEKWTSFIAGDSPLVFNEVLFRPSSENQEWIEIINRGSTLISGDFIIRDATNGTISVNLEIQPDTYNAICLDSLQILDFYPAINPELIVQSTGWTALNNSIETLWFVDNYGTILDSLQYDFSYTINYDNTLARFEPDSDNWQITGLATPAAVNQFEIDLELKRVSLTYNDGIYELFAEIHNLSTSLVDNNQAILEIRIDNDNVYSYQLPEIQPSDSIYVNYDFADLLLDYHIFDVILVYQMDTDNSNNIGGISINTGKPLLVLSEIMFKPSLSNQEWIEIFVPQKHPLLQSFKIRDEAGGAIHITNEMTINNFYLFCYDAELLKEVYPDVNFGAIIKTDNWINLNNSVETIYLVDNYNTVLDSHYYEVGSNFTEDNTLAKNNNGDSNWLSTPIATPGMENTFPINLTLSDSYISQNIESDILFATINNLSTQYVDNNSAMVEIVLNEVLLVQENIGAIPPGDSLIFTYNLPELADGYSIITCTVIHPLDYETTDNQTILTHLKGDSPLIFNEVLFKNSEENQEWIELVNRSGKVIDLEMTIWDASNTCIRFQINIPPKDLRVICREKKSMITFYPEIAKDKLVEIDNSWFILNNTSETLFLKDNYSTIFDSLSYSVSSDFATDRSLEQVNPWDDEGEWLISSSEMGATPTLTNSVILLDYDVALELIEKSQSNDNLCHVLSFKDIGINPLSQISVSVYNLIGNQTEEQYLDSREIDLTQETVVEFFTPLMLDEYVTYLFAIESELDQNIDNDRAISFHNTGKSPYVVNEIMYNAEINQPEWIEMKRNLKPKHLHAVQIVLNADTIDVELPDEDFFLITSNSSDAQLLKEKYGLAENITILSGLPSLSNDGESVVLYDPSKNTFDEFYYSPKWSSAKGVSIERISSELPPEDSNWAASVDAMYATPGRENSLFIDIIPAHTGLSIEPNPFSPYRHERALISFEVPENLSKVNCRIFDLKGRLVKKVTDQSFMAARGHIIWDGKDEDGKILPVGIYIMLFEAVSVNNEKIYKKKETFVIAK